jgi:hypothetical protein
LSLDFESASEEDLRQFVRSENPPPSNAEIHRFIENFKKNPRFREARQEAFRENVAKKYQGKIGVFCLTPNIKNFPMWAHYGENHIGIAIGFDAKKLINETWNIYPVEYVEKFPSLSEINAHIQSKDTLAQIKLYFCRKSKHWEYECEKRIVKTGLIDTQRNLNISSETIHSIYFGSKMDNLDIDILKKMILNSPFNNVKLYKMKIAPSAFNLIPEPL